MAARTEVELIVNGGIAVCSIDFSLARFDARVAELRLIASLGGITVVVPEALQVEMPAFVPSHVTARFHRVGPAQRT